MVSQNPRFHWLANHRALDFLNTEPVAGGRRVEWLPDFRSLVLWCVGAGFIEAPLGRALLRRWGTSAEARAALARARELRSALRRLLSRRAAGRTPSVRALSSVNRALALELEHTQIVRNGMRIERQRRVVVARPEQLLRPIAEAAVNLLCEAEPLLIRRCESSSCVLLFYDVSKNHARRWCSMDICGNRQKVASHYQRRKVLSRPSA